MSVMPSIAPLREPRAVLSFLFGSRLRSGGKAVLSAERLSPRKGRSHVMTTLPLPFCAPKGFV